MRLDSAGQDEVERGDLAGADGDGPRTAGFAALVGLHRVGARCQPGDAVAAVLARDDPDVAVPRARPGERDDRARRGGAVRPADAAGDLGDYATSAFQALTLRRTAVVSRVAELPVGEP